MTSADFPHVDEGRRTCGGRGLGEELTRQEGVRRGSARHLKSIKPRVRCCDSHPVFFCSDSYRIDGVSDGERKLALLPHTLLHETDHDGPRGVIVSLVRVFHGNADLGVHVEGVYRVKKCWRGLPM